MYFDESESVIVAVSDFSPVVLSTVASPWQMLNFAKLPQPARQFKPRYLTVAGLASVKNEEVWK